MLRWGAASRPVTTAVARSSISAKRRQVCRPTRPSTVMALAHTSTPDIPGPADCDAVVGDDDVAFKAAFDDDVLGRS